MSSRSARTDVQRAAAAVGGLAAATAVDVGFDPVHRHVPLCPLHAATGLWCPLCGGLRAADELARGHVVAALHYNALLVLAVVPMLAGWYVAGRADGARPRRRGVVAVLIVLTVAFTVLRNLPWGHALRG